MGAVQGGGLVDRDTSHPEEEAPVVMIGKVPGALILIIAKSDGVSRATSVAVWVV